MEEPIQLIFDNNGGIGGERKTASLYIWVGCKVHVTIGGSQELERFCEFIKYGKTCRCSCGSCASSSRCGSCEHVCQGWEYTISCYNRNNGCGNIILANYNAMPFVILTVRYSARITKTYYIIFLHFTL